MVGSRRLLGPPDPWRRTPLGEVRGWVLIAAVSLFAVATWAAPVESLAMPLGVAVPEPIASSELFDFHNIDRVNLHHLLYQWGTGRSRISGRHRGAPSVTTSTGFRTSDEKSGIRPCAPTATSPWSEDLLFDEELVRLRDHLAGIRSLHEVAASDRPLLEAVDSALPVYSAHWWARHERANRSWLDGVLPLARRHEAAIAPRVAAAYGGSWPEERIHVDITAYANRVGAYTTSAPHVTLSSEADNQGALGLELLFHESSHGDIMERPLLQMIDTAFAALQASDPGRDLWHMVIFVPPVRSRATC